MTNGDETDMAKIKQHPTDPTLFMFWDIASGEPSCFWVKPYNGATWTWNGDCDNPTVNPSILNTSNGHTNFETGVVTKPWRNHIFIRNGKIEYLSDCTHNLAGKTVDMVDFPDDW